MSEDIRDTYMESARVAMNLSFWEDMAIKVLGSAPEKAKEIAVELNETWEKAHSVQLKTE